MPQLENSHKKRRPNRSTSNAAEVEIITVKSVSRKGTTHGRNETSGGNVLLTIPDLEASVDTGDLSGTRDPNLVQRGGQVTVESCKYLSGVRGSKKMTLLLTS